MVSVEAPEPEHGSESESDEGERWRPEAGGLAEGGPGEGGVGENGVGEGGAGEVVGATQNGAVPLAPAAVANPSVDDEALEAAPASVDDEALEAAPAEHTPASEQRRLRETFREMMKQRFLAGGESHTCAPCFCICHPPPPVVSMYVYICVCVYVCVTSLSHVLFTLKAMLTSSTIAPWMRMNATT